MLYDPTWASIKKHVVPKWFDDAKFGIFIHWGPYSVPAWATPIGELGTIEREYWFRNNPYAEWYLNTLRIEGSPTWEHHRRTYGEDFPYEGFVDMWKAENWDPDEWATLFKEAGARYVIPTTKHHDGFCLWPTRYTDFCVASRGPNTDIIGRLAESVRKEGMRFGIYYSGALDWQFTKEPLRREEDFKYIRPHTYEYADYAYKQVMELIDKYNPDILWNDIGWPEKSQRELKYLFAYFYNKNPEGVVNDRWEVGHWDFVTAEYHQNYPEKTPPYKWEFCRGLGYSFGYNQNEGKEHVVSEKKLIFILSEVVSKGGNLLLNVGPKADGTIPEIQRDRLLSLGRWLRENGEAIYGTSPWSGAEDVNVKGGVVKFTRKKDALYMIVFDPGDEILLEGFTPLENLSITLVKTKERVSWKKEGDNLKIYLPHREEGTVLKLTPIL